VTSRSGTRPRRAAEFRVGRLEASLQGFGVDGRDRLRQRSVENQRSRQRLDGEATQHGLGRRRLTVERSPGPLLAQPLDLGLDAIDLARLPEVRARRGQVSRGQRVGLGVTCDLGCLARAQQPLEGEAGLDLQHPARRRALR
jgi:hypothetical protein